MSKRYFQEKVSFVNFLASTLVNKLKQNRMIIVGLEEENSPTLDRDRKVDNTIYRSAQINSLVRKLYYDRNDPFNLKVLAKLQKQVPEELSLLINERSFAEEESESSKFTEDDIPF